MQFPLYLSRARSEPEEPADIQQADEDVVPVVVDHEYHVPSSTHWDDMLREIEALSDELQAFRLQDLLDHQKVRR